MTKMDILESKCYNSVEEGVIVEEWDTGVWWGGVGGGGVQRQECVFCIEASEDCSRAEGSLRSPREGLPANLGVWICVKGSLG